MTLSSIEVQAPAGALSGSRQDGTLAFRGIPYARPPVGQLRFTAPQSLSGWQGVRDCTQPGPMAPQGPSRLACVVGDFPAEQSEDCLSLTVWTPQAKAAPRAVMVWVHGGAYMTGAGALDCYAGDALARNGDVVVVAPNFRLGALGFLHLPGVSEGNLGLLDLALALRWVRDNIAAFGGDPGRVTVFGQSSGAATIRSLMTMPQAKDLFHRAVIQSAPLGRPDRTPAHAAEIGRRYAAFLGLNPSDREGFQRAGVDQLLAAQGQLARSFQTPLGTNELPFTPVVDGKVVRDDATWFAGEGAAGRQLIVGFNAQEAAAGYSVEPAVLNATVDEAVSSLRHELGEVAPAEYQRLAQQRTNATPADVLCDFYSARLFGTPSIAFARRMAASGVRTWVYRFDWQSPSGLEACHCLELPFVFDNIHRWEGARMIEGVPPAEFAALAQPMQQAWTAFARHGNPDNDLLPHWPSLAGAQTMMMFDSLPLVRPLAV